jgi:hypothetical protein
LVGSGVAKGNAVKQAFGEEALEEIAPRLSGRLFEVVAGFLALRRDIHPPAMVGQSEPRGEVASELLVALGFLAAKLVVEVENAQL